MLKRYVRGTTSSFDIRYCFRAHGKPIAIELPTDKEWASFCRKTHETPYLENSEGEALGVRKLACAFHIVNIITALKAAALLCPLHVS
jgi:hypothetical protein